MDEVDRLKWLALKLGRLEQYTSTAAGIEERAGQLGLLAVALQTLAEGESDVSVADVLRQAAADARTSAEAGKASSQAVAAAVDSAIGRLAGAVGQTLSQADVDAITVDLTAAKEANDAGVAADTAASAAADTIDPGVTTTGLVAVDGSGGVSEVAAP